MQSLTTESINYDYLPGEPESRRTWYVTLRFPPPRNLVLGSTVLVNISKSPYAIFSKDQQFKVIDVHGRHVVIEPLSGNIKLTNINENKYSDGTIPKYDARNSGITYPRMGRYTYAQRPMQRTLYQDTEIEYIPYSGSNYNIYQR